MTITINGTTGITNDGGYTGDGVVFADTTPANTLVTTTGGNVGFGTSSPAAKLDVSGGAIRTTIASKTAAFDAAGGSIYTSVNDGTKDWRIGVGIMSAGLFSIRNSTDSLTAVNIDSSGNLLVGTTSSGGVGYSLTVDAAGRTAISNTTFGGGFTHSSFRYNGTQVGAITTSTTATTYATSSDYRLKEAIVPMTGALTRVAALKPVTYKWKADGSDGEGFIAHELQAVVPDCVTGEKDAVDAEGNPVYQGIDTSFLVATLTAAIQEQQAIILAQESALNALTARVAALDARLTSLEGTQP